MFRSPLKPTKQTSSPTAVSTQSDALLPAFARSPSKLVISDQTNPIEEACEWLNKAKEALGASRNIKTEIKNSITISLDHVTKIIQTRLTSRAPSPTSSLTIVPTETCPETTFTVHSSSAPQQDELLTKLEHHSALLDQNNRKMDKLMEKIKSINTPAAVTNALRAQSILRQHRGNRQKRVWAFYSGQR
ncbi:unnamed protein product [Pieris brassicae]|uniref:Uncharacterized protein n=1 Tax=Pieris brassicae TaxID=7116 RepID=A0A9P0TQZ5_PIEBR|nr:unnamed protein product [Pieris brassicae]